MTTLDALKSISNYPTPQRTFDRIAVVRRISLTQEATPEILLSREYQTAEADLMNYLASAPNVSEGGVSFSFSQAEKEQFKRQASFIMSGIDTPVRSHFGYKGENL